MQIYKVKYLNIPCVVGRCKWKVRGRKKMEYFIINASRVFSSGDFSSDTAGWRLKGKGVKKLIESVCVSGWYEKYPHPFYSLWS